MSRDCRSRYSDTLETYVGKLRAVPCAALIPNMPVKHTTSWTGPYVGYGLVLFCTTEMFCTHDAFSRGIVV